MCMPCRGCVCKYVYWCGRRLFTNVYAGVQNTCVAYKLVSIHTRSACTGVQQHLFRACHIHHNKCTYTRACTPMQTVQQRLCNETLADRPRILKRPDGQRNLELKTMMMLQMNQASTSHHHLQAGLTLMAPSFILQRVHRIPPFQENHQNQRQLVTRLRLRCRTSIIQSSMFVRGPSS